MRFHETRKRKIVSTGSANTVGRVDGYVVDVATHAIAGIRVKKGDGDFLPWSEVVTFGPDAVTVASDDAVRAITHDEDDQERIVGHRLLTTHGEDLGKVTDVDFDAASGALLSLTTSHHEIPGDRLRGIGDYAVVVAADGD